MSPALTKNEYGIMIRKKKKEKKGEEVEEEKEEKEQPMAMGRTGSEHAKKTKVLNESEPQEARRCKGSGK